MMHTRLGSATPLSTAHATASDRSCCMEPTPHCPSPATPTSHTPTTTTVQHHVQETDHPWCSLAAALLQSSSSSELLPGACKAAEEP